MYSPIPFFLVASGCISPKGEKIISSGDIPNSTRSPCRTSWNPSGTLVEPWWNPGGIFVEPYLRAARTTPEPIWAETPKLSAVWGIKTETWNSQAVHQEEFPPYKGLFSSAAGCSFSSQDTGRTTKHTGAAGCNMRTAPAMMESGTGA